MKNSRKAKREINKAKGARGGNYRIFGPVPDGSPAALTRP